MNEPHDLTPETSWFDMAQASINAIQGSRHKYSYHGRRQ